MSLRGVVITCVGQHYLWHRENNEYNIQAYDLNGRDMNIISVIISSSSCCVVVVVFYSSTTTTTSAAAAVVVAAAAPTIANLQVVDIISVTNTVIAPVSVELVR